MDRDRDPLAPSQPLSERERAILAENGQPVVDDSGHALALARAELESERARRLLAERSLAYVAQALGCDPAVAVEVATELRLRSRNRKPTRRSKL